MNIGRILTKNAARFPQKIALVDGGRRCSFRQFNQKVNRLGNALMARGIQKGDRVGILLPNCPEFLISFFSLAKIGATAVPVNFRWWGKRSVMS